MLDGDAGTFALLGQTSREHWYLVYALCAAWSLLCVTLLKVTLTAWVH